MQKIVSGILLLFVSTSYAAQSQTLYERLEKVRSQLPNAGLAVAIVDENGVVQISMHGYQDYKTKRPIDDKSLFMIGSTTKAFVSTTLGKILEEKGLAWDVTVKSILPSFQLHDDYVTRNATFRDILSHRTGLPRHDFAWYSRSNTMEENFHILQYLPLSAEFRKEWQYNNFMYLVAGMALASLGQSSWVDMVRENILLPLGMHDTYFTTSEVEGFPNVALPHAWNGEDFVEIPTKNIDGMGPAGSIHSNIIDMAKWLRLNIGAGVFENQEIISTKIMNEVRTPVIDLPVNSQVSELSKMSYGLGWIRGHYRGELMISHSGGIDGYLTYLAFFPKQKKGIIVLTNGGNLRPAIPLFTTADYLLELEPIDWVKRFNELQPTPEEIPNHEGPQDISPVIGTYEHIAYGEITVSRINIDGEQLASLKINDVKLAEVPLWKNADGSEWYFEHGGLQLKFLFENSGKASTLEINIEPKLKQLMKFKRKT